MRSERQAIWNERPRGIRHEGIGRQRGWPLVAARVSLVVLALACAQLLLRHELSPSIALAAGGNDPMTITLNIPTGESRHMMNGVEAYCCDSYKTSPPVGTVLSTWNAGDYALDYVLYHSDGCPAGTVGWSIAKRVVWALLDVDDPEYTLSQVSHISEQTHALYDAALAFRDAGGRGPERGTSRIYDAASTGQQRIAIGRTATIKLEKVSTNPEETNGNPAYSLAGAEYAIFRDEACTDEVIGARMVTDESGHASSVPLGAASATTYYVRETSPSRGFKLSDEVLVASVSAGSVAEVTSHEEPNLGTLRLVKESVGFVDVSANGSYSLEGAEYGVFSGETCTDDLLVATLVTDSEGRASAPNLVVGTYWVRETKASAGHELDPEVHQTEVRVGQNDPIISREQQRYGWIDLVKTTSIRDITSSNACYDLDGASYGIYSDSSCGEDARVQTLTLRRAPDGSSAHATSTDLAAGSYWVRELAEGAPRGYRADETIYPVTVELGATARVNADDHGVVQDVPAYASASLVVSKVDAEASALGTAGPQGSATLAGGRFEVRYYDFFYRSAGELPAHATRTWVFQTNAQGEVRLNDEQALVSGDAPYRDATSSMVMPLGTYAIRETQAPAGYWLEGQDQSSPADYVAPTHISQVVEDPQAATGASFADLSWEEGLSLPTSEAGRRGVADRVKRAGLSLSKLDRETGRDLPQGGASLSGITFAIINRSDNPVICAGQVFNPGDEIVPLRLVTNERGAAATSADALPLGTYEVVEVDSNGSYLLDSSSQSIHLMEANANNVVPLGRPFDNNVVRGGVRAGKVDLENGHHAPQGASSFAGVVLGVRLSETDSSGNPQHAALVDGATIKPGALATTITLDHEGFGETDAHALPYGSWELVELSVPKGSGYLPNEDWSRSFDVRNDGMVVDLSGEADSVPDRVKRGDLRAVKAEESSQARLARIPFVIESLTTGEWHVAVTDENGQLDTSSGWASRISGPANASDKAVTRTADGAFALTDPTALDDEAGIWFSGRAEQGLALVPNDQVGALPYDSYRLTELRVSAEDARTTGGASNEGSQLAHLDARVYRDATTIELGTIDNQPMPAIATYLTYGPAGSGIKVAPAEAEVSLTDTVSYQNLEVGAAYTIAGELHLLEPDGSDGGIVATGEQSFTASLSSGSCEIAFTFDASELAGRAVVAFERLYSNNVEIAAHADLADEGQTVGFARIGTTLTDESGSHEAGSTGIVQLLDTVAYEGLLPGETYELSGALMDRDTGEAIDLGSGPLFAYASFVPDAPSGEVTVSFEADARLLAGHTVVAFETLSQHGREIAIHADIEDEGQSVSFPCIGTTLTDQSGGGHVAPAGMLTLVDTVSYDNLIPGTEYALRGTLMDAATGAPLLIAGSEDPVQGTLSFVPESPQGSVNLEFSLDASALTGSTLVAFEELSSEGRVVAAHADMHDEGQTVRIPALATTLTDAGATGLHEGQAQDGITLVDTISYSGVMPGQEYQVTGTLVDKETGEPITDPSTEGVVTATTAFVPQATSGLVEVSFVFDARLLAGHTVVAFERLEQDGRTYAVHADIDDQAQSFRFPAVHTTLTDADGLHEVAALGIVSLVDTVAYENLEPGTHYVLTGSLRDRASGEPLIIDGKPVSQTVELVPEKAAGAAEVRFELPADQVRGRSVVAFEEIGLEGRVVATHADIHDEGQTVTFPRIGTRLEESESGEQIALPIGRLTLVDTVAYDNLTPGASYRVTGTLMDKETGAALKDGKGNPLTAETTIEPKQRSGIAKVMFVIDDASSLAGRSVVAFERVERDGRAIAIHEDLLDADQTVAFPRPAIKTTLIAQGHTGHEIQPNHRVTLVDAVSYEGLVPGREYRLSGTLMDKETGKEIPPEAGATTASTTFVAERADGTAEVAFELDATHLRGTSLVAFETLTYEDRALARHADLESVSQSLSFTNVPENTPPQEAPSAPRMPWMGDLPLPWPALLALGMGLTAAGMRLRWLRTHPHGADGQQ